MSVELITKYLDSFIKDEEYCAIEPKVKLAHNTLHNENNFTGWLNLPSNYDKIEFNEIKKVAQNIIFNTDVFIVIGVGGSYLGARAVIELIKSQNYNLLPKKTPNIYFVGNNFSSSYLNDILKICKEKNIILNVISKSGNTLESSIAFRIFKKFLEDKYGKEESKKRIFCTTDKHKGSLKQLAEKEGYKTFNIPDNIGGRYSVLTAVGLLPMAVAGINIDELMLGAKVAQEDYWDYNLEKNACYKYAAIRNLLYQKGKNIEILASYEPNFTIFNEWFKQLFAESEGKNHKGIFPVSTIFSADLHSIGQYIQDGVRNLFETVLNVEKINNENEILIEKSEDDLDGLNFLSNKTMSFVNKNAFLGTVLAHTDGGVANIILNLPKLNEFEVGYLLYFFEKACAISGYILGVNPFNQPGVETYKENMFSLLEKPGYDKFRKVLFERIN